MPVSSSTEHWIKPDALTINLNHFGDPDYLQVSVLAGAVVMAFKQDVIFYNAAHNYRTWPLDASNTYLETTSSYNVYARLTRSEVNARALVVYDPVLRDIEGREITYAEDGSEVLGDASTDYFFVFLGQISASVNSVGSSVQREWNIILQNGSLNTNQYQNEESTGEWSKMFRLNKITDYIDVLKTISSAVFKKLFIKEKGLEDVATAADKENEKAINDTTIATTSWVSEKFSEISDDRYLRKDQSDRTPYNLAVGGVLSTEMSILFQNKQISGFIRKYDDPRPEVVTDTDFYSALMTDERIEEELRNLDDRYLRKDHEDTAHKHITFEEGITVYELAKMMNLEVTELATISRAIVDILGSSKFVDGFFGEGYQIWKSIATGDWNMTIDRLTVRKVMTVYELVIQKIRSVGGMIVVSAGNGKIKEVSQIGLEYRFTFEDTNTFAENDLIRCQVWTGTGIKYYWVEVVRVDGESVYTRVADYQGVVPTEGDEVVLMGNTKNKLRQGLVVISAAEDGQPRVDCLDGVHTTNFEGCLKARLGALDGISDNRFPADMQPKGYGLYGNNCYLTGVFVLSNGKDVQTQFAIMEGMIRANMSSIQQQINAEDNYLSNASLSSDLNMWEFSNDVKVFRTSGGLLHFNGNFYSNKNAFAAIVPQTDKNVLRLKNSFIRQKNANLAMHPNFDLVEQTTTDSEGNEIGTGVMLYRPRMFYVSFRYMVARRGTLRIRFENEESRSDFESYTPLDYTKVLEAGDSFTITDDSIAGKWNGTGDFYLSFDGDMYLYDLALSDDPLSDMEERWSMQLEITEKKIQVNAEHIIQNGKDLEEYRSEFLYTADELRTTFTAQIENLDKDLTQEYQSYVQQTAQSLTSDYTAKIGDYYGKVTQEYNSKITQTAQSITAELSALIDNTNKALDETEAALIKDYTAKISASAESLESDYNAKITDLRTGDIATMQSSITQQANLIATKVSQTDFNALTNRVTTAETSIKQNASAIELRATKTELNALTNRVTTAESNITTASGNISALSQKLTFDSSGNLTNISKSGLVLDSEFASMFTTQVNSQGIAKTAQLSAYVLETELSDLVSKIEISADQIDLRGVVTYDMLSSTLENDINNKATKAELSSAQTSLNGSIAALNSTVSTLRTDVNEKASAQDLEDYVDELNESLANKTNKDLSNAVLNGTTFILNGLIRTKYIDVVNLVVQNLEATDGTYTFSLDKNGFSVRDKDNSQALLKVYGDTASGAYLNMWNFGSSRWLYLSPNNITLGSTQSYALGLDATSGLMNLNNGLRINNFGINDTDFTVSSATTFNVGDIYYRKWAGRVYFYYFTNECTVSGLAAGSVKCKYGTLFYYNGSSWYHFSSKY